MAKIMDIPAPQPTRPAAPKAKGEKTAQGSEDSFGTALNEENLKQAKGPGTRKNPDKRETRETRRKDDVREDTDQATAAGAAGTTAPQSQKTADKTVKADEAVPATGGTEARRAAAAILTEAATKANGPDSPIVGDTAVEEPTKPSSETVPKGQTSTPAKPLPGNGEAADTAANANPRDGMKNRPVEIVVPESTAPANGEIARQQAGQVQPMQNQADQTDSKTGRSGLMEASFAGLLQPTAGKGHILKGNPEPAINTETGEIGPATEAARLSPVAPAAGTGEADADLAKALLKEAAGQPASSDSGESQTAIDKGHSSLFDSALASAGAGKPEAAGEMSPLQGTAHQVRSDAGSLNQEVRVLDQVLNQLPLNRMSERNRVIIRLHPEELGEVKLDLVMDKDQLKAHLVTQTQQVQNILEKHLPRLQEALQNQGVKLDQIQVSVDSRSSQGREFFDRNQQSNPWGRSFGRQPTIPDAVQAVPAVSQARTNQQGLSLRI
jgi:flagellar hook-length control protein FliK